MYGYENIYIGEMHIKSSMFRGVPLLEPWLFVVEKMNYAMLARIDSESNPFYFATTIEYENGAGDMSRVEIQNRASGRWLPMQQSFGAVWKINAAMPGPLSFRITSSFRQTVVATKCYSGGMAA
ncbi:Expansin-B18 [Camellia lanceoleosa]|uniref:Expansin-B18 n=1 Tax=Camellia lanceoleosa TaxID=1840588 RepID=A0ACC0IN57_9ERIC|nr:Expansin-B18 [Camellia lanceoleosa]